MMNYEEIMCYNCKECIGKAIEYSKYGNCEIVKCKSFYPKYKFKDKGELLPFFVAYNDDEVI